MSTAQLREAAARRFRWNDVWEATLARRPEFVAAAVRLNAAAGSGRHLDDKIRAFIRVSLNASVTHLSAERTREAIRDALDAGATREELVEVLMVASTVGIHGMNADVLAGALAEQRSHPAPQLTERQESIREQYRRTRGYWREFLNDTLRLAPEFLAAYLDFSGAPWEVGVLDPKVREFLYLAFDTSPTHLHLTGLRIHIDNALSYGASPEEIIEVMELASVMGLQTLDMAMPILDEELRGQGN